MKAPPLALYAHFPWCVQKCPYCDFNSHALRDELPEQRYLDALLRDFDAQVSSVEGRVLTSIFLGGGTPSLFSPAAIGRLIAHAKAGLGLAPDAEITLEANPGTIERGRFAGAVKDGSHWLVHRPTADRAFGRLDPQIDLHHG